MNYLSTRLKNARKMNGFSLDDLSAKLDGAISKQDLNRFELDKRLPDGNEILLLANALGVPVEYFYKSDIINLENVSFRKLTKLPKKEQEAVKAKTIEYLERYLELEEILNVAPKIPFKLHEHAISEDTPDQIHAAANAFREQFKIGNDPIYNIIELLEENGIKVFPTIADTSFSGMSTSLSSGVMVIVFNNNDDIPLVRKRFTLLHEVAHLFLNLSGFEEKVAEKICDSFAGAVLLPKDKLFEYFGGKRTKIFNSELYSIKSYFGISIPAILYQAKFWGLVSDSYFKYFMINYNKSYVQKEKEGYSGNEKSERFIQLLLRATAQEIISLTKAASLNNQKLSEFRKLYAEVPVHP